MANQKTIQQIAKDNDIAPTQVSAWKKELESRISEIFERKNASNEAAVNFERKSARLERKIGNSSSRKNFLRESATSWESTRAKSDDHTEPPQALSSASEQAARCESKSSQKTPGKMTRSDTELVALIDGIYMECPFFGQRQLRNELQKLGHRIGRSRIRRLMKLMGLKLSAPSHRPASLHQRIKNTPTYFETSE